MGNAIKQGSMILKNPKGKQSQKDPILQQV